MAAPTIGRIVLYRLSAADAEVINSRRADYAAFARKHVPAPPRGELGASGHQAHVGNHAMEGDPYPAVVVRVFDEPHVTVNLKVLLDGTDEYWATSRAEGTSSGCWSWAPRT